MNSNLRKDKEMGLTDDFHNAVGFYKEKHGNTAVLTPEQVNIFIEIVELLECGRSSDFIKGFICGYSLCKESSNIKEEVK